MRAQIEDTATYWVNFQVGWAGPSPASTIFVLSYSQSRSMSFFFNLVTDSTGDAAAAILTTQMP